MAHLNNIYIKGNIWAEMSKSVSYTVDVCFDINMIVQEAQCECGAGQGPTAQCKHIACVLYALHMFDDKKEILSEQTCTQVLYTNLTIMEDMFYLG